MWHSAISASRAASTSWPRPSRSRRRSEKDLTAAEEGFGEWSTKYEATIPADNAEEHALFEEVKAGFEKYNQLNTKYVELSRASQDDEAGKLFRGEMDEIYITVGTQIDQLLDGNAAAANSVNADNDATYATNWWIVFGMVGLLVAVSLR